MAEDTPLEYQLEIQGGHIDNMKQQQGDSLVDIDSSDTVEAEKMLLPTEHQEKSTRLRENMETGDHAPSGENISEPEGLHTDQQLQYSGDSLEATDLSDYMSETERTPSPKSSEQTSSSQQEDKEYMDDSTTLEPQSDEEDDDYEDVTEDEEADEAPVDQLREQRDRSVLGSVIAGVLRRRRLSGKLPNQKSRQHQENKFIKDTYSPEEPSNRILELSRPKEDKRIWATRFRKIVWGNQEPIWPRSFSALSTIQSKRLINLAKPKKNFQPESEMNRPLFQYCLRQSISAPTRVPVMDVPSERLLKLAEPKKRGETPVEERPQGTPLNYKASDRIVYLALPRPVHSEYLPARQAVTRTKASAVVAATPRGIRCLANPKCRTESPCFPMERTEIAIRPVSQMARCAVASLRVVELARPKEVKTECQPSRSQVWQLSKGAARATATARTIELSQPVKRAPMNALQYNPDAFIVKEAAKRSACSSRIDVLAQPIMR